jgi:hypothetical protein
VACAVLAAAQEPDLRGIWQVRNMANVNLERAGVIVNPANGKIPYREDMVGYAETNYRNRETADPQLGCFQPGVPRATYVPEPFQIFQKPGRVYIVYQHVHAYRVVFTDGRPHYDDGIEFYMGDSRGRWDGNTLIVDVTNFKDETWLDSAGNFHSNKLHVVERYTRTGPDRIQYEATLEDPEVFEHPWTIRMTLERHAEPGFELVEHECERDAKGAYHHPAEFQAK